MTLQIQQDASSEKNAKTLKGYRESTLMRSQIAFHEMNPRHIDKHAFNKMVKTMRKIRLVQPIVVNVRSEENGFSKSESSHRYVIVGGHQRTKAMDVIHKYDSDGNINDYSIPVALIDVDKSREAEILVALNNPGMQGNFDFGILEQLFETNPDIDIANTGFERIDLAMHFDEGILDGLLGEDAKEQAEVEINSLEELQRIKADGDETRREKRELEKMQLEQEHAEDRQEPERLSTTIPTPASEMNNPNQPGVYVADGEGSELESEEDGQGNASDDSFSQDGFSQDVEDEFAYRQMLQNRKHKYINRQQDRNSASFMAVFVAETEEKLVRFLQAVGLPRDQKYYALNALCEYCDINIEDDEE